MKTHQINKVQDLRVIIICILASVVMLFTSCNHKQSADETTDTEKVLPNIIYVLADDLGYGDLGSYGQKQVMTPQIDRLAKEGMRFTQHYAGSTVCAPSRCALMTGMHIGHAKVRGNATVPLDSTDITIPELLKQAGYATGLIGKWGLGEAGSSGIPNKKGFDYFFGYLSQRRAHNYYTDYLWRNEEKVPLNNELVFMEEGYAKGVGSAATVRNEYSHDLMAEEALAFIEKNQKVPFFLYLAFTIPHANNEHHLVDKHGMEVPNYGDYADMDWPEPQKGTAAMISRLDKDIGRMLDLLVELGIDSNTVVFFSSDNGPHREGLNDPDFFDSNGPLRGIKRDFYEGGIRVPFLARWPAKIKPGSVSEHISAFWDLLPTVVEMAGVQSPVDIDGISFLPELTGRPQQTHEYLYWEFYEQGGKQAVRKDKYKAVRLDVKKDRNGPIQLYDLSADIGETTDVAEGNPEIVAEMAKIMNTARTDSEVFTFD